MASIFSKAKTLFKSGNYKELFKKTADYVRFIAVKIRFATTLKETDRDLKKVNKNWIFYTYLKAKYKQFLANYKRIENKAHIAIMSGDASWKYINNKNNLFELLKSLIGAMIMFVVLYLICGKIQNNVQKILLSMIFGAIVYAVSEIILLHPTALMFVETFRKYIQR